MFFSFMFTGYSIVETWLGADCDFITIRSLAAVNERLDFNKQDCLKFIETEHQSKFVHAL